MNTGASEFVPGKLFSNAAPNSNSGPGGSGQDPERDFQSSMSGINLAASSWVPGSQQQQQQQGQYEGVGLDGMGYMGDNADMANAEIHGDIDTPYAEQEESTENMVQVNWNGSLYYVPESMSYTMGQGADLFGQGQTALDDGFDWADGSFTLPAPPQKSLQTLGIPEPMRQHFRTLDIECLRQMKPDDERYKEIPIRYHSAFPLDTESSNASAVGSFGYPSSVFKVIDRADSYIYTLRRFDNVRNVSSTVLNKALLKWKDIKHPSIVSLHDINYEKGAIFFSYAYHPAAQTLKRRFLDHRGPLLNESLIWRILVQLVSGLRLVHNRGLALRVVDPVYVLLTSGEEERIRIS